MIEFRALLLKAFAGNTVQIPCTSYTHAYNLRQRFYRYRDKIRESNDELNLLVDDLCFEIDGGLLVITYDNPENLLEALNDDPETGDKSLKSVQQHKPTSAQGSTRNGN